MRNRVTRCESNCRFVRRLSTFLPEPQPAVQEGGSPQFFQPPQPPPVPLNAAVMPAPDLPSSGPIKETVRIPLPTVQTKKTQPLVAMPEVAPQSPSIAVAASREKSNAAVVAAAWCFRVDFDYSDLDLSFLKPWIIPLLLSSMNPILTVK